MEFPAAGIVRINPIAWCLWAVAALAAAFIDRNPYLQLLLLLVLINVWLPARRRGGSRPWKLGLLLAVTPIVFSVALSRYGAHILFRLPDLPVIGGPWTAEALAFGASTGAALLLVVAVFGILQVTVHSADLVGLLPRPLYRAGTVFALAVAFAPQTVGAIRAISEARHLRRQRSGWRAAPALLVPLLLTTMERALQYGESLDARGFGSRRRSRYRRAGWQVRDFLVVVASAASLIQTVGQPARGYNAYQDLMPPFPGLASLLAVLALVVPAVLSSPHRMDHATDLA